MPATGLSGKLGFSYEVKELLRVGLYGKMNFLTPTHVNVLSGTRFINTTTTGARTKWFNLEMEPPTELGLGASLILIKNLVLSLDGKYILWNSAAGWKEFEVQNQLVLGFGAQYSKIANMLNIRLGYTYASDAMDRAAQNTAVSNPFTSLQGMSFTRNTLEGAKSMMLPMVTSHHLTLGFGVDVAKNLQINLGGMYALPGDTESVDSNSTGFPSGTIKSEVSMWSLDFGVSFLFN